MSQTTQENDTFLAIPPDWFLSKLSELKERIGDLESRYVKYTEEDDE